MALWSPTSDLTKLRVERMIADWLRYKHPGPYKKWDPYWIGRFLPARWLQFKLRLRRFLR